VSVEDTALVMRPHFRGARDAILLQGNRVSGETEFSAGDGSNELSIFHGGIGWKVLGVTQGGVWIYNCFYCMGCRVQVCGDSCVGGQIE